MNMNVFRMPEWYPKLEKDCFPTVFLELDAEELEALKEGRTEGEDLKELLPELKRVMGEFSGAKFVYENAAVGEVSILELN